METGARAGGVNKRRLNRPRHTDFLGPHSFMGLLVALGTFLIDQIFKIWMIYGYRLTERERVEINPFFDVVLTWNKGVSYGLFEQGSMLGQYLLGGFKLAVALGLVVWMARVKSRLVAFSLALIIGGALGNALDRFWHGGVADFFSLHYQGYYWYIFNLADVAITFGVALLIIESFFSGSHHAKS